MVSDYSIQAQASSTDSTFYEIRISGFLDPSWSPRMGDLTIESQQSPVGEITTILRGPLPDQSALMGVLNSLADRSISLLSMQRIEDSTFLDVH